MLVKIKENNPGIRKEGSGWSIEFNRDLALGNELRID